MNESAAYVCQEAAVNYRLLWIGLAGFGIVWRGVEHQFYRDIDGSMGKRWTHQNLGRWTEPRP